MKPIFEPSDFALMGSYPQAMDFKACAAHMANTKINKLMADWPLGYATIKETDNEVMVTSLCPTKHSDATHVARLAFIEPIKREPCKHEAEVQVLHGTEGTIFFTPGYGKCKHCGAELEATWKVKGET